MCQSVSHLVCGPGRPKAILGAELLLATSRAQAELHLLRLLLVAPRALRHNDVLCVLLSTVLVVPGGGGWLGGLFCFGVVI